MFCSRWKKLPYNDFVIWKIYKTPPNHWSQLRKPNKTTDKAMDHFDDFYASVFGELWQPMRKALLQKSKYVALVNNFSDDQETIEFLERLGAHNMKRLFEVQKEFEKGKKPKVLEDEKSEKAPADQDSIIKSFSEKLHHEEIETLYQSADRDVTVPETIDTGEAVIGKISQETKKEPETVKKAPMPASLASSLQSAQIDESRIIMPEVGHTAPSLWTFVPATQLMGRDDWIPESAHYKYYSSAEDFPLTMEDDTLVFPEKLKVYSFENNNMSPFPEPKRGKAGVLNYYLMDGASVLPVIALNLQAGDKVLDMCAGPGGKSLVALQTLLPEILVANDVSHTRVKRILQVFRQYLYDFESSNRWADRVIISNVHGLAYEDPQGFDKILVDVPCTTDRHTLKEPENNIFSHGRVRERLKLPELQSSLLSSSLKLCKVGGTVVYSTCTLSPIQNDGVVHMALKQAFEQYGVKCVIKKLTQSELDPLKILFRIGEGQAAPKYGHLITPYYTSNFGPSYFAKLVRTQ